MRFRFKFQKEMEQLRTENEELRKELDSIRRHLEQFPDLEPCISEKCYSCENVAIRRSCSAGLFTPPILYGCMRKVKCEDYVPTSRTQENLTTRKV